MHGCRGGAKKLEGSSLKLKLNNGIRKCAALDGAMEGWDLIRELAPISEILAFQFPVMDEMIASSPVGRSREAEQTAEGVKSSLVCLHLPWCSTIGEEETIRILRSCTCHHSKSSATDKRAHSNGRFQGCNSNNK
jgi:hypothetical protein